MKIAIISPIIERVPPKKYGGTERVVNILTEGLIKKGHQVTLFATGDTLTSAKLISVVPKSLKESQVADPYGLNALTALHIGLAYKLQDRFDIIHDHIGPLSLPTANLSKTPVIMTMHGPFTDKLQELFSTLTKPYIATISDGQLIQAPKNLNHAGTVYNGLNMEHYPFSNSHQGYLLFVGRITRDKGVHIAIKLALKLKLPLIIAAKLEEHFQPDIDYYNKFVKPHLSHKIRWIGEVTEDKRNKLMSKALAFLHPISWSEPFGLTLIESMACGTPVIAYNLGSIPEIVQNGISGYVVSNLTEMITAVKNINQIDRQACRRYALKNFSGQRMVDGYLKAYHRILTTERLKKYPIQTLPFEKPIIPASLSKAADSPYDFRYAHDIEVTRTKGYVSLLTKEGLGEKDD